MKEREIAVFVLMDILGEGAYNNIILRKALNSHKELNGVQKAFITELVNGTLRNLINIDYIIDIFSKTPVKKMKPFILCNLRVGIYQIMYMDRVPVSAACNEAVKLAKKRGFHSLSGFVNGVLRSAARNRDNIEYPKDRTKYLSLKYSYPSWIIEYWLKEMDYDTIEKICISNNSPPHVSICVNTLKTDKNSLADMLKAEGMEIESNTLTDSSLYLYRTNNIAESKAYQKGLFHIMDESSLLSVKALAPKKGSTVLDLCAAPGGKSFAIAEAMENTGLVISRDIYEHKVRLIEEGAARLGLDCIRPEMRDALIPDTDTKADYVVVDAPCSGLGLVRKKPDIKYSKKPEDIDELVSIQRKILTAAEKSVAPDGILLYSTCTISHRENIDNVMWFCDNFDFEPDKIENITGYDTAKEGHIQILPCDNDTDGFFIARLRRKNG